ncbi:MAG: hypothetical protein H6641_15400 [Caldilineaceae bacterium]|nr:hypothetical protein [Caldilineaceae bacterium]
MSNSLLVNSAKQTSTDENTNVGIMPDYFTSIANVLQTVDQPVTIDELVERTAQYLPSANEKPQALVRRALEKLYQAVPMGQGKYGWLSNLLQNNWIRHPLTTEETEQGFLLMDELEHAAFFPQFFQTHRSNGRVLKVDLLGGPTIEAEAYIERKTWSLKLGAEFVRWVEELGGQGRDDLLIWVNDARAGHYTLRLQPREARVDSEIQERNIKLALMAEELIRQNRHQWDVMPTWELAARLVANGAFMDMTPPDDLHCILHQYSLLHYSGSGYMLKSDIGHAGQAPISESLTALSDPYEHLHGTKMSHNPLVNPENDPYQWSLASGVEETQELWQVSDVEELAIGSEDLTDYDSYLDSLCQMGLIDSPLSPDQFHLLQHELEFLVSLERQFGYLLPEQKSRQKELKALLLIDARIMRDDDLES